jgi:Ca2+-binding RTX toxin-like protein
MSTVSFFAPTDMATVQTPFGTTLTSATSTEITFTGGGDTYVYTGSFTYAGGSAFGTMTGFETFVGGTLTEEVTGLSVNANTAFTLVENNELQALFQLALPGNDVINGSSGNDVLIGYNGNDMFKGGGGNDIIGDYALHNTSGFSG